MPQHYAPRTTGFKAGSLGLLLERTRNNTQLTVVLFTKNSENSGEGQDLSSPVKILSTGTMPGQFSETWRTASTASPQSTIEELVRYKFTADGEGADDWIMFRMLSPVWFDDVTA